MKKDFFKKAKEQHQKEQPKIKDWQFLNWICYKGEILKEGITPIEKTNL